MEHVHCGLCQQRTDSKDDLDERRVTEVHDLRQPLRALCALAGPHGGVVREATPCLIVVASLRGLSLTSPPGRAGNKSMVA
jgi:hypothetical protein